jgi:hypothetical protein
MYNLMDFFQTNRAYPNQPGNRVRIRKLWIKELKIMMI